MADEHQQAAAGDKADDVIIAAQWPGDSEPPRSANADLTIRCFQAGIAQGQAWSPAIALCDERAN